MIGGLSSYKHIVDKKIKVIEMAHPMEGHYDKTRFIEKFASHFGGDFKYESISNGNRNNLYKISYNGYSYNLYIEHFDGGGRDKGDGSKKISIPAVKAFMRLIEEGEPVLIINEYCFLKTDTDGNIVLDDENYVYGIIKPEEVYNSKVIKNKTGNPSSRWVKLEQILESSETSSMKENNENNVYIIPGKSIASFFDLKIIDEEYETMTKYIYENEKDPDLSESKICRIFRENLIKDRGCKCQFKNCRVNVKELLVASHIESRSYIRNNEKLSDEDKMRKIGDINNGFLLCRTHDSVFDKKFISFDDQGYILVADVIKEYAKEFNLPFENEKIIHINEKSLGYLKVHRSEFEGKNFY